MEAAAPQLFDEDRWREFESARLRLARLRVAGGNSLAGVLRSTTEEAARVLEADRVGIWLFVDDRRAIRCYDLFEREAAAHSEGAMLRAADFPAYFRSLEERRAIVAEDARNDPQTAELSEAYLKPLEIAGMLDVPVYREGNVIGVLCHETKTVRRFGPAECDFATSVADAISRQIEEAARREAEARVEAHEAHLAELKKMEALGRLAAGVAHDFKNVLTVVLGCAYEIEHDPAATPAIGTSAREITQAANRGAELARELLALGREEESRATAVVDAAGVVEGMAPMLRKALQPNHSLHLARIAASGSVLIERAELERVVLNLVLNARDAMPGGGAVAITIGDVPIEGGPARCVVIEVADSGVGMDAATRARLFEPFFTTKSDGTGTGIGMAVVYQIVERTGGFIHVDSAPGVGTRVRVALPRVASRV